MNAPPSSGPRPGPEDLFVVTGLFCLLGGVLILAGKPQVLLGHFYSLPLFGITHVLTLGWISTMILGVMLRLAPMQFGTPVPGRKSAYTLYGFWIVGASGVAMHMARNEWFGVWTAAIPLLITVILLFRIQRGILRRAAAGDWGARYVAAAMIHLALAASLGTFIALNKHLAWMPLSPYRTLSAHFHLAEVGWVTLAILGFGRKLQPPLAGPRDWEPHITRLRFWSLEAGLLGLVVSLLWLPFAVPAFTVLLALAVIAHLVRPLARLVTGQVRDRASFWVAIAMLVLAFTVILGSGVGFGLGLPGAPVDRMALAYGFLALVGWNTLAIVSFAFKVLPLRIYELRTGGVPDPSRPGPRTVYLGPVRDAMALAILAGAMLTAGGILWSALPALTWGTRLLALGVALFAVNILRMAWALTRPVSSLP